METFLFLTYSRQCMVEEHSNVAEKKKKISILATFPHSFSTNLFSYAYAHFS